jgi:transaldolase/glucose-6-phosphate isomerase
MELDLPSSLGADVDRALEAWDKGEGTQRLFARDAKLWTGADEAKWLGWLDAVDVAKANLPKLEAFQREVGGLGYSHVLLMGMGGSSLAPEVLAKTYGLQKGFPELLVLDSTDPAQVRSFERRIDPERTLFIVASKSGSTLEPNIFLAYFLDLVKKRLGEKAGERFVAITDPNSKLQAVAEREKFRAIFAGEPTIGGRYSALSNFGLVPAAAMGIDLKGLIASAEKMLGAVRPGVAAKNNPGILLGTVLGVAATKLGRDKVTFFTQDPFGDLGAWLEQLIAESTGKHGKAIIPVDREWPSDPSTYGDDRVFVHIRSAHAVNPTDDLEVAELARAGHPVIRIVMNGPHDLGAEFFRWEIATAVAGVHLGINPFDQPDVEAAKIEARKLTDAYERDGRLPEDKPFCEEGGLSLFTDGKNLSELNERVASDKLFASYLRAHIERLHPRDYFAITAYVPMTRANEESLQAIRHLVRNDAKVATCLGFGPRFLHSTGQAYKGGPNSGVFLQITCDAPEPVQVPGAKYTFGVVKSAQAAGDFQVLCQRGRRVLRVHLPADAEAGLRMLVQAFQRALP